MGSTRMPIWGLALAILGTIIETVPPACIVIGTSQRRSRSSAPDNADLDAPVPP